MTTWQDIPGWTCPRIIELYDEMARELKPGMVAVECGVAYGKSLAYLASVLDPGVDILAVDIWQTFQGRTTMDRAVFETMRRECGTPDIAARMNVSRAIGAESAYKLGLRDGATARFNRIEWVQARSEDVPKYLDFDVDFVFLDDHHEEESVYAEIMAWLPKLKSGGVIAGHDVNDHYPGVERAARRALDHRAEYTITVRPPAPGENGWGGTWRWRKP